MAILIDSLGGLDYAIRRKFKKVFAQLNDNYVVRSPVKTSACVADLIIEGPEKSWLLIGVHQNSPTKDDLSRYLNLSLILNKRYATFVRYLAVTESNTPLLDAAHKGLAHVQCVDRKQFFGDDGSLITQNCHSASASCSQWLKKTIFPETSINPALTSRREQSTRDNSAQMQSFFLDYDQEMACKLDIIGNTEATLPDAGDDYSVRLINGVAGSGKTLILINRAILYCNTFPEQRVLLLIHNKPITRDIEYKIDVFLEDRPKNLTIKTFHAFALGQKKVVDHRVEPLFKDKDLRAPKEMVLNSDKETRAELTLSDAQLWSEIEYINEFLIKDKSTYLKFERQGRGFTLQKRQREAIWQLYEKTIEYMSNRKGYLPSLYIRELCLKSDIDQRLEKFDHILLDEAQFFSPSWLRLVLRSLKQNGQLFICADPNQGFLKSRLSWKTVGLNVRGRTKVLKYSYRTTYEIFVAANALLKHFNEDPEEFIQPDLSKMTRGEKPRLIYSDTPQDELKRFLNELKAIYDMNTIPPHHIMVLCGESLNPWSVKTSIEREIGRNTVVNCNAPKDLEKNFGQRIKLVNMNSCTGLESGVAFILGVGEVIDAKNNLDLGIEEAEIVHQQSIRKLYVAMTRAGQKLVLFSTQKLPAHVEDHMSIA